MNFFLHEKFEIGDEIFSVEIEDRMKGDRMTLKTQIGVNFVQYIS